MGRTGCPSPMDGTTKGPRGTSRPGLAEKTSCPEDNQNQDGFAGAAPSRMK
ncbi:MAG: hypothetical protein HY072_00310 [Deltaproteobacteria bacterium]|nr:hypothetical protein [Deltaproteobacteria bacterium]